MDQSTTLKKKLAVGSSKYTIYTTVELLSIKSDFYETFKIHFAEQIMICVD